MPRESLGACEACVGILGLDDHPRSLGDINGGYPLQNLLVLLSSIGSGARWPTEDHRYWRCAAGNRSPWCRRAGTPGRWVREFPATARWC